MYCVCARRCAQRCVENSGGHGCAPRFAPPVTPIERSVCNCYRGGYGPRCSCESGDCARALVADSCTRGTSARATALGAALVPLVRAVGDARGGGRFVQSQERLSERQLAVLLRLLLFKQQQRHAGVEDLCTRAGNPDIPREPAARVPSVCLGVRWLLLAFLAAASGLLTFTAREPPRTRAAVRRSARERLVLPEPRPAPHGETAEATEPAPPEEEGRGFARLRPCRVRVVTGANSQPVPGARAWGMRLVGDELDVRRSTSDSRGELVLPDSFAILVRKTGYVPHFDSDLDEMPREVRLRPGLPLRGRVILHGGAPVAGARVYAWDAASDAELVGADFDQGDPCSTGFTPTDQDGCFEIDGVAGEFILCIVAAGFGVYRARHQPAPEMLVALGRGGVVEGHVFDDKGRPVAEARVYVEQEDGGYDFGAVTSTRASAHTKSGPDGMYRIVGLPLRHARAMRGAAGPVRTCAPLAALQAPEARRESGAEPVLVRQLHPGPGFLQTRRHPRRLLRPAHLRDLGRPQDRASDRAAPRRDPAPERASSLT